MNTYFLRSALVCSLTFAGLVPLHAGTYSYTITDSTADLWSAGTNWDATPVSDADTELVFGPAGAFDLAEVTNVNTNDFGTFQLNSLTLQGTGAEGFTAATTITGGTLNFVNNSSAVGPQINLTASPDLGAVFYAVNSDLSLTDTLTLTGDGTAGFSFGGAISGTGGLVKSGLSTVVLTGANSYGATTVNGGTLAIDHDGMFTFGTLGNGPATLNGATVADAFGGSLEFRNTATAGSNTITANGGTVAGAFGSSVGFFGDSTAGAATLTINGGTDGGYAAAIGFYENSLGGTAAIELNGSGTYLDISFHNGGLTIGSLSGSGSVYLGGNTLSVGSNDSDTTFSGALQDGGPGGPATGSLTKTGTGTLTLAGDNTYTGDTAIEAGTLVLTGTLGGGDYLGAIANVGVLSVSSASDQILEGVISGSGSLVKDSIGKLTLTADHTYTGGTTISGGTLQLGNNTTTGSVIGDIANNGALVFAHTNDLEYADVISGTGSVEQAGSGILTLSGENTYTGATTVSGGTLALSGDDRLSASTAISITNGATLDLGGHSQTVAGLGSAVSGLVGTVTTGTITTTGDVYLASGTFANTLAGAGRLYIGGSSSTVNLNGTNDATTPDHEQVIIGDSTTGAAGTVKLGNANALAAASENVHLWSGVLNLNGQTNVRANSIVLEVGEDSALVNIATGTTASFGGGVVLVIGKAQIGGSAHIDLSGVLSGSGGFTKTSSGTVTLSNDNTYTGDTEILAGPLVVSGSLGSGNYLGAIANSGSLTFSAPSADQTLAGVISGTGTLTKSGTGTLTLSAANTYSGNSTISAGTLEVSGSLGTGLLGASAYPGVIANSGTLAISSSTNQTLNGIISGTGTLTKSGTGTLTLGATNTYLGGTVLNDGILGLGANNALGSGLLTINGGNIRAAGAVRTLTNDITANGSFTLGRSTTLAGAIALATDIAIHSGNPDTGSPTSSTISGVISGAHSLTFGVGTNPTGTIVLTGENTYTGGTTISGGNLQIGNSGTTGSVLGDIVNNGSLVFARSDATTYGGVISGTGSVIVSNYATVFTLTGTNTYEGGTTINDGLVQFATGANLGTGDITLNYGGLRWAPGNTTDISSRLTAFAEGADGYFDTNGNDVTFASPLSGTPYSDGSANGYVVKIGAGTLTLAGVTDIRGYGVQDGTLDFGTGAYEGSLTVVGGQYWYVDPSSIGSNAAILSGAGTSFHSLEEGLIGWGGSGSYSSSLTVTDGAAYTGSTDLYVGNGGTGQASLIISGGGSVSTRSTHIGYTSHGLTVATVSGAGSTFTATNLNVGSGLGFQQLVTDNSSMTFSDGATGSVTATVIGRNGAKGANSLTISGTATKFTTGTLTLAQGSTDNGTVNIGSAAGVAATGGGVLDTATVTGGTGAAVLQFNTTGTNLAPTYFTRDGSSSGAGVNTAGGLSLVNTAGTTVLTGAATHTGGTTITGGALQIGAGGTAGSISGNITDHASLVFNRSDASTYDGAISGTGSVTKAGAGTLTLTGENTYTGATTISGGTLLLRDPIASLSLLLDATTGVSTSGGVVTSWGDLSGQGNNAVAGGGSVTLGTLASGRAALVFGGGSYLSDPLSSSGSAYTIFSVFQPNTFGGAQTILGSSQDGALQFRLDGNRLQFVNQLVANLASSDPIASGPTFATASITSGAQKFYVDTTPAGSGSSSFVFNGGATFRIGSNALGNEPFSGAISLLLVYNSILSPRQITAIQNAVLTALSNNTPFAAPSVDGSLPSTTALNITTSGAALDLGGAVQTVGSLAGVAGSHVYLGSGRLIAGGDNTSTTFAGDLRDGGATAGTGGSFVKAGTGTLTLTGTSTFTGTTTIGAGKLVVDGSIASSSLTTVSGTGTLGGHGTVGAVTVASGGTISPGNSPGTLTTGAETWSGGGSYVWEINDATGTAGTNWDLLSIGGSLDIAATTGSKFTIYVTSLDGSNVGGHPVPNFNSALDQSWVIATTTGAVTGYSDGKFAIDTSAFFNSTGANSSWHLSVVPDGGGNDLLLTYTAIPEPSAYAISIAGLLGGIILLRRRRTIR